MADRASTDCTAAADTTTVENAREAMLATCLPVPEVEVVPLAAAGGRVLAEALSATHDSPPTDNSAMDGYALRVADLEASEGTLPVGQRIPAGVEPEPLAAGTAARIFTGGVIPAGADTVVMQERCEERDGMVRVPLTVRVDENIRRAGEDQRAGTSVLPAGCHLRAQSLAVAASAGHGHVPVHRRVTVGLLITGAELVTAGQPLPPGRIYNSNGPMLQGLADGLGAEVRGLRVVTDTAAATRDALADMAADCDLVISSGGVSVGDEDHVRGAVEALGDIRVHKVSLKPGKPVAFGTVAGTPFLGLPGNPVSVFVTFALFGAPLLRRLQGRQRTVPEPLPVAAGFSREGGGKHDEFVRVRLEGGHLRPYEHQGSGVLSSVEWASGLARIRAGAAVFSGAPLDYHPFSDLLA